MNIVDLELFLPLMQSEEIPSGPQMMESNGPSGTKFSNNEDYDPKKVDRVAESSVNSTQELTSKRTDFGTKTIAESATNSRPSPSPMAPANSEFLANSIPSHGQRSGNNSRSDSLESISAPLRPHTGGDVRWDAINMVSKGSQLNLSHFRLLKRLGYGDIGSVYLVELRGTNAFFAMKVMDKASLASRNKLLRAQTEREILGLLDHPFLPTLYSYFETDKFYCLVMEYCSGGNLHSLRQKQPNKHFTEEAARLVYLQFFSMLKF